MKIRLPIRAILRLLFVVAPVATLTMCGDMRGNDPGGRPPLDTARANQPAGSESDPIAGRVDLPPEQPRR